MTPPINPRTKEGKSKFIYDTILSLKEIAKKERGFKRRDIDKGIDFLSNFNNSL